MKKIALILLTICFSFNLFAQVSVDPNDKFYREAQGWELRGLTEKNLPLLRPYTINVIKEILNDVIENKKGHSTEKDIALAKEEYERIFGKKWKFYLYGGADLKTTQNRTPDENNPDEVKKENSSTKNLQGQIGVKGDVALHDLIGVGYNIGFYGQSADFEDIAPYSKNMEVDSVFDPTSVSKIDFYANWNTNLQFGNTTVYGTAGVSRVGFGPFMGDGLALNDNGYHSANILFSVTQEKWSFASVFEIIGATTNVLQSGHWLNDGKYLAFHTINLRPCEKFDFSYYENVMFGPRVNLAYLFPSPYMAIQNIGGANDNLQMGVLFNVKPIPGLSWATDFFADDIELNDVVKLHFDTKLRFGVQSGVTYHLENSVMDYFTASYQAVLPYVYAHWEYETDSSGGIYGTTINYQNYMNSGVHIGSALDPNSDKVSFSASLKPLKNLTLDVSSNFIRHSNSAEAFGSDDAAEYVLAKEGQYATDGSAYMHQMFSDEEDISGNHVKQAWKHLGFMTSDHKMYITQAGLNAQYDFPKTKKGHQFSLKVGYTFEYIKNAGVDSNVYNGLGFERVSGKDEEGNTIYTYNFNGKTDLTKDALYDEAKEVAREQKQNWIDNLRDKVNNYVSVSVKYQY